jgi:hypothetical protein
VHVLGNLMLANVEVGLNDVLDPERERERRKPDSG